MRVNELWCFCFAALQAIKEYLAQCFNVRLAFTSKRTNYDLGEYSAPFFLFFSYFFTVEYYVLGIF